MLLPKSCSDVIFCTCTTEYNAKGPAMPMRLSCTVAEESILGLSFPGWGTGSAMVPFKVRGGLEVRSWVVAFISKVVRTEKD